MAAPEYMNDHSTKLEFIHINTFLKTSKHFQSGRSGYFVVSINL